MRKPSSPASTASIRAGSGYAETSSSGLIARSMTARSSGAAVDGPIRTRSTPRRSCDPDANRRPWNSAPSPIARAIPASRGVPAMAIRSGALKTTDGSAIQPLPAQVLGEIGAAQAKLGARCRRPPSAPSRAGRRRRPGDRARAGRRPARRRGRCAGRRSERARSGCRRGSRRRRGRRTTRPGRRRERGRRAARLRRASRDCSHTPPERAQRRRQSRRGDESRTRGRARPAKANDADGAIRSAATTAPL